MIKTYDKPKEGRTKVFFVINEDGETTSIQVGNNVVPTGKGFQFFVDDYVAGQIDKCELVIEGSPTLAVKEGEVIHIPEESEEYKRRKRIEELKEELRRLKEED